MNQEMNRPIKLDKLALEILRRWRLLIIVFIIGLVVGITYSYFDNINEAIEEVDTGKTFEELEQLLSDEEKEVCYTAMLLKGKIRYIAKSELMKLDAENVPTSEAILVINSSNGAAGVIANIYQQMVSGGAFANYLSDKTDKYGDVSELITVGRTSNIEVMIDNELYTYVVDGINRESQCESLYIKVQFRDPELCQSLMEEILVYMEETKEKIENQTGKFEINLVNKAFSVICDSELIFRQESVAAQSYSARTSYLNRISEMNDDMKTYYNYLMMEYASEDQKEEFLVEVLVDSTDSSNESSVDIKTVVLVVMALEICVIAILLLSMLFAGKIIYDDDWKSIFNIDYLGQLETGKKKRIGYRLDRWINSKSTLVVDKEMFAGILSLRVNNIANTVAFLCLEKYDEEMRAELSQISPIFEDKVKIIIIDEVMADADRLRSIDEADNYIICAKKGRTGIDKMGALVQLINSRNGKIIGGLEWE